MWWFNKHLHLTWLFYMIVACLVFWLFEMVFIVSSAASGNISQIPGNIEQAVPIVLTVAFIWLIIIPIPINLWVLHHKNRKWTWIFLSLYALLWFPLILSNKNDKPEQIVSIAPGIRVVQPTRNEPTVSHSKQSQTSVNKGQM
ncbi:MAG: hypothetical protein ACYDHZ_05720 [Dehalococcoidia bacterium]